MLETGIEAILPVPGSLCVCVLLVIGVLTVKHICRLFLFICFTDLWEPMSPLRLVLAIIVPYAMAQWGLRKHSLSNSGARAGAWYLCFLCLNAQNICCMKKIVCICTSRYAVEFDHVHLLVHVFMFNCGI